MQEDARRDAARYRAEREARERGEDVPEQSGGSGVAPSTREERWAYIETSIQQAIRSGEFDDLPGAGKPLTGLGGRMDADWWIRQKIENEKLGGLGPPALTLRTEHAELDARLDRMHRPDDVRQAVEDFNKRVIEARRQLQGGPPVITPTRDVDAEVTAWRERRAARVRAVEEESAETADERPSWRERRRRRRAKD